MNGLLDPLAGHGTFIAGVVRQHCPEATLMVVPVMHGDGVTDEAFLVETLSLLYVRQLLAHSERGKGPAIDVLSLSLGYYHETPGAFDDEPAFCGVLRALASTGVAVVAAAGNGGTNHEFYPAAFAVAGGFDLPVTSVGALNPDGPRLGVLQHRSLGSRLPLRDRGREHDADDLQRQPPADPAPVRGGGSDPWIVRPGRLLERVRPLERHLVRSTGLCR